jgi:hypothetical protein
MANVMEDKLANSTEPAEDRRPGGSFSIAQWCQHHGISVSFFYKLDAVGKAPATKRLGRRRIITQAADEAWSLQDDSNASVAA